MSRGKKAKKKVLRRRRQDSSLVNVAQGSTNIMTRTIHNSNENRNRNDSTNESGSFAILFENSELQKLRQALRKSDLSSTPLLVGAIVLGKTTVARKLLEDGSMVNDSCPDDRTTPLMWAVRSKNLEMINLLVHYGADVTMLDKNRDNVALIAVQSSSWSQNDFLDFWHSIDSKINLNHVNRSGNTILDYANKRDWSELVQLIESVITKQLNIMAHPLMIPESSAGIYCSNDFHSNVTCKPQDVEATISYLSTLFEDIILCYRMNWQRDKELGYPGYKGGKGDPGASIDEQMELRKQEVARLNAILPKLEDSYMTKLKETWLSLVSKIRQTAYKDPTKFREIVTLVQMQLLSSKVRPHEVDKPKKIGSILDSNDCLPGASSEPFYTRSLVEALEGLEFDSSESPSCHVSSNDTSALIYTEQVIESLSSTQVTVNATHTFAELLRTSRSRVTISSPSLAPPAQRKLEVRSTKSTALTFAQGSEISGNYQLPSQPLIYGSPTVGLCISRWDVLRKKLQAQTASASSIDSNVVLSSPGERKYYTISPGGSFGSIELGLDSLGNALAVRRLDRDTNRDIVSTLSTISSLRHFNILPFTVCIEDPSEIILGTPICEYNLGEYLMYLKMSKGLEQNTVELVKQFLSGLNFLHTQYEPMVHGNIKPSNLLISQSGDLKLAEFGLWKLLYRNGRPPSSSMIWFARETYRAYDEDGVLRCNCASDVQVAGMIVHFILTGGLHAFGTRSSDILDNILQDPPKIHLAGTEIDDVISWMLTCDPNDRPCIGQVLAHVFFWDDSKKWSFLLACAGISIHGSPLPLPLQAFHKDLEAKTSPDKTKSDWVSVVRARFPKTTFQEDDYSPTPTGLLTFIRNRIESQPSLWYLPMKQFILKAFPMLPLSLYRLLETTQWLLHPVFSAFTKLS